MNDVAIEELLKLGKSPEAALNLTTMLKEANKILKEAQTTMSLLDKLGLKTLVVRGTAKKYDIDIDTPLKGDSSIVPKSDLHALTFKQMNTLSEADLAKMLQQQGDADG